MLKIGEFSRLSHVTVKALRHYGEMGLLKPAWIDRFTGYRYYSLQQLPRLNRILALKELGFSLEEIAGMIQKDFSPEALAAMLDQKRTELFARLDAEQERLARVEARLRMMVLEGGALAYDVVVKHLPEQAVLSIRETVPTIEALPERCAALRAELAGWMTAHGVHEAGPWFTVNENEEFTEQNVQVEVAVALHPEAARRVRKTSGRIRLEHQPELPAVASVIHPGDPADLLQAYTALFAWVENNGYRIRGACREVCLDDPSAEGGCRLTEVQCPVERVPSPPINSIAQVRAKGAKMEPKIVTRPAMMVVGMRYYGKNEHQEIKEMWGAFNPRVPEIKHIDPTAAYGVCIMVEGAPQGEFEYIAGFAVRQIDELPTGMVVRQIPAGKYAVFPHRGSLAKMGETYQSIYQQWLPQYGLQPVGNLDFEYYGEDFKDFSEDSVLYIYVPVKDA